jgi:hypothetical protein
MEKSESIKELAKALSSAQAVMIGAKKDSNNPFFKSSYADLESVWNACREPLTKNGLSVAQTLGSKEDGIYLTTILMHSSGEYLSDQIKIPIAKPNDPQALGSATSYCRRYSLAAIIGLYQTDDDAESVMDRKPIAPINQAYIIPIGQHKGKTLEQVTVEDLDKIIEHLENNQTYGQAGKDLLFRAKQNRGKR